MYKKMSDTLIVDDADRPQKAGAKTSDWKVPQQLDFLTPTFMTVLSFFLADPFSEYYEREVARKTGVSRGSAHNILVLLAKVNFLTRQEKGRMLIYKLNLKEPTVKQLKITVDTFALKTLIDKLKAETQKVMLFGSCAQGTDTKDSDIDLLVITSERDVVKKIISQFNQNHERRIVAILVDVNGFVRLKNEDKPLYENIQRGIVLWEQE